MTDTIGILKQAIDAQLTQKERVIVAIDGSCTAGKTTLAAALQTIYGCNVFHMDDFFLRPEQRTPERYAETGGNVDYERFWEAVLIPLKSGESFFYCPFSCKSMTLSSPVAVMPGKLHIIEGTYSMHPSFGDPYDLRVFCAIDPERQRERVLERPAHLHEMFFNRWIPMEQQYFIGMDIAKKCDFVFYL